MGLNKANSCLRSAVKASSAKKGRIRPGCGQKRLKQVLSNSLSAAMIEFGLKQAKFWPRSAVKNTSAKNKQNTAKMWTEKAKTGLI